MRRCNGLLVMMALVMVESADILLQEFQQGSMSLLGDAFLRNGSIELTKDSSGGLSSGRALFPSPIRLVDRASNATASFNTSFTFSITNTDAVHFGDGLAFIFAPSNTTQGGPGGWLGFLSASAPAGRPPPPTTQHSLAVEFDTFLNVEFMDPNDNHVGVDVDSMVSLEFADAGSERVELKSGRPITAWIQYDSGRQEMEVSLSYNAEQMPQKRLLSLSVNLYAVLDEYMFVGFSAATGGNIELHSLHSWQFSSSGLEHLDEARPPAAAVAAAAPPDLGQENQPERETSTRCTRKLCMAATTRFLAVSTASAIAGAVIVSMILWLTCSSRATRHDLDLGGGSKPSKLCSCLGSLCCFWRGKERSLSSDDLNSKKMISRISSNLHSGPRRFTFKELSCATKGFSQVLGYGAFGTVYKGRLRLLPVDMKSEAPTSDEIVEVEVAVKRANRGSKHGREEFMSELSIIGCLRHRNLVQLQGWCREKNELLLVYDFMPNGSLDKLLFDKSASSSALKWSVRFKVVVGIGSALAYLHSEWEQQVVHRDVKASNIMLDANLNARLGDFGLARLMEHDSSPETTITAGTVGYLAPEYLHTGKATDKTDVFSFGIVALEVASGRRPITEEEDNVTEESSGSSSSSSRVLVDWAWGLHRNGKLLQAADPKLGVEFEQVEMLLLLQVGLLCCHPDPTSRPSMKQAVQILCGEMTLPPLPKAKPRPSFASLPPVSIEDIIQE
ncbi:probable L-type lectin-domain containing receptor kinase S.7 [Selaginella moellendorffii]|uniref:probable L-type lectin-domain containing receptor kinase S.7 n=1 Tax=Selaginella moellendorffii TaxID=88036 RepID=UPI000D1C4109|nr:probable L-type lectin-domain containing receptor kinase S.7 [Selaginella moellendorffii]|eukprot:XP_024522175.1 probable L-type lectin-domain containing receptor kinase S.7 [Selaginella moellendorffii]